jgi:hypothetical protein
MLWARRSFTSSFFGRGGGPSSGRPKRRNSPGRPRLPVTSPSVSSIPSRPPVALFPLLRLFSRRAAEPLPSSLRSPVRPQLRRVVVVVVVVLLVGWRLAIAAPLPTAEARPTERVLCRARAAWRDMDCDSNGRGRDDRPRASAAPVAARLSDSDTPRPPTPDPSKRCPRRAALSPVLQSVCYVRLRS